MHPPACVPLTPAGTAPAPCNTPLTFERAWSFAMSNPQVRNWLFSSRPATTQQLLQQGTFNPFLLNFSVTKAFKMYGQCYRLSDGTALGFVLCHASRDTDVPLIAAYDAVYEDNRFVVSRIAVFAVDGRVCHFEFCWLCSGALRIRFHPLSRMAGCALIKYDVIIFSPVDAAALFEIARQECPGVDFLAARFDDLQLKRPWYRMTFTDISFQSPCVYCTVRGDLKCECPTPMRRRTADDLVDGTAGRIRPTTDNGQHLLYGKLTSFMRDTPCTGSLLYNIVVNAPGSREVPFAGIVPFNLNVKLASRSSSVLQQFLVHAGSTTGFATRAQIPLIDSSGVPLPNDDCSSSSSHASSNWHRKPSASAEEASDSTYRKILEVDDDSVSESNTRDRIERSINSRRSWI